MDKGRRTIIVLALSVLAILLIICHIMTDRNTTSAQEAWLDAEELHYDANGPFILIDKETAQLGYYAATAPIWHMHGGRISADLKEGVYRAYKSDNGLYFFSGLSGDPEHTFVLMLTDEEMEYFETMPRYVPALVR